MEQTHFDRQSALFERLPESIESVILTPSTSLQYLTDLAMIQSDRPVVVILSRDESPAIVLPKPGVGLIEELWPAEVSIYPYRDSVDPIAATRTAVSQIVNDRGPLGTAAIEFHSARLLNEHIFDEFVDWSNITNLDPYISELRATKDGGEIERLRRASAIIDDMLEDVIDEIEAGMTEPTVQKLIYRHIMESEADDVGSVFVASGSRSASPWAQTSKRTLSRGDPVMMDVGAVYDGYYSDITRTYSLGEPQDGEWVKIYDVVRDAVRAALDAIEPETSAGEVDDAARSVIEAAGYGDAFPHRLGHGLGLSIHEKPHVVGDSDSPLRESNAFAIEPGIYIDGLGGVRIEDNVVVTSTGPDVLSTSDRELRII